MMDPIVDAFACVAAGVSLSPPKIPVVSNVTGTWLTAGEATDPAYWARHLRQTVRFADAVTLLARAPTASFSRSVLAAPSPRSRHGRARRLR